MLDNSIIIMGQDEQQAAGSLDCEIGHPTVISRVMSKKRGLQ